MKKISKAIVSSLFLFSTASLIGQPYPPSGDGMAGFYGQDNFNSQERPGMRFIQWMNRFEDAVAASKQMHKPILILFTGTNWCPACMRLEREVLNNPQFIADINQKFIFLKAEFPEYTSASVANSPFKPLLDRYGIQSFPTIVVVDPDGSRLFVVHYQPGGAKAYAQELLGRLQQYSGKMGGSAPSYQDQPQAQPPKTGQMNNSASGVGAAKPVTQMPFGGNSGSKDEKMDSEGYYIP